MDCNENTERESMKSTIALLLSFAAMAERVAVRSYFVRCIMLWILHRAEISALRYVHAWDGELSAWRVLHRNSPAEALRLAAKFCELAQVLKDELRLRQCFSAWWKAGDRATIPEWEPVSHRGQFTFLPQKGSAASSFVLAEKNKLSPALTTMPVLRVLPPP